ncbi:MAG: hypothetical protein EOO66_33575 [Methylobacterium sp.]|nr:MAG: hypothetical protein EOO66_33575 [Methylobacterium sp.]
MRAKPGGRRWRREIASFAPATDMSRITQAWVVPSGQVIVAGIITVWRPPPDRFSGGGSIRLRWLREAASSDHAFATMPRCSYPAAALAVRCLFLLRVVVSSVSQEGLKMQPPSSAIAPTDPHRYGSSAGEASVIVEVSA